MKIAITIMSWFFYAIALVMKSYANRFRFMAVHDMPMLFSHSAGFASKFWLTRLAITYASLVGLWYVHGWRVLIVVFLFYIFFCMFTFIRGSRNQINKWARIDFDMKKGEASHKGESFDETTEWFQSWNSAKRYVEEQMRRNGKL